MAVVRFAALLALVIWIGGLMAAAAPRPVHPTWLAAGCGGVLLVALFAMKFLGPPPHGFVPRVAIVVLMLAIAFGYHLTHAAAFAVVDLLLGLALLAWYVRE